MEADQIGSMERVLGVAQMRTMCHRGVETRPFNNLDRNQEGMSNGDKVIAHGAIQQTQNLHGEEHHRIFLTTEGNSVVAKAIGEKEIGEKEIGEKEIGEGLNVKQILPRPGEVIPRRLEQERKLGKNPGRNPVKTTAMEGQVMKGEKRGEIMMVY